MSNLEEFRKLKELAIRVHPHTWCIIKQVSKFTRDLNAMECVDCKEYILNKGICDPL